jgi:hypothetical protein
LSSFGLDDDDDEKDEAGDVSDYQSNASSTFGTETVNDLFFEGDDKEDGDLGENEESSEEEGEEKKESNIEYNSEVHFVPDEKTAEEVIDDLIEEIE